MRVVHLESGMHLYGGAQQVLYLMAGLRARGVHNTLICARGSAIATALDPGDADCLEVPMTGDLDLGFTARCRALLQQIEPDLLHVHSRRGADLYGGLAARGAGVPAVITRRVDNPERPFWARLKYGHYRAVIAISMRIMKLLRQDVGLPAERLHLVPSAVDTARFRPQADVERVRLMLDVPDAAPLIGVAAQLIRRKGHEVLLEALAPVVQAHPDVRVLLFGQGPLAARLERRIKRLGLSDHVRLVGFRHDLERLLPGLDLVVHPALTEGLGVALLEALACGVAVIASNVGGIPDLIEDRVSGRLVAPGDAQALGAVITQMLDDPSLRRRLGAAGRQRVLADFSIEQMVDGNLKVYEQVLA
jgi:glycosyltransferase involved in cell wall biosynthesis